MPNTWRLKALKIDVFHYIYCRLMPCLQGTPANIRINIILPETTVIALHWNIHGGLQKHMYFETKCKMAVQGHPSSLILVAIESVHATCYSSSTVTILRFLELFLLSSFVSEILQVSWEKWPTPIPPVFWGCSPQTRLLMLWLREAKNLRWLLV